MPISSTAVAGCLKIALGTMSIREEGCEEEPERTVSFSVGGTTSRLTYNIDDELLPEFTGNWDEEEVDMHTGNAGVQVERSYTRAVMLLFRPIDECRAEGVAGARSELRQLLSEGEGDSAVARAYGVILSTKLDNYNTTDADGPFGILLDLGHADLLRNYLTLNGPAKMSDVITTGRFRELVRTIGMQALCDELDAYREAEFGLMSPLSLAMLLDLELLTREVRVDITKYANDLIWKATALNVNLFPLIAALEHYVGLQQQWEELPVLVGRAKAAIDFIGHSLPAFPSMIEFFARHRTPVPEELLQWRPERHHCVLLPHRRRIQTLLILARVTDEETGGYRYPRALLWKLPLELLFYVFQAVIDSGAELEKAARRAFEELKRKREAERAADVAANLRLAKGGGQSKRRQKGRAGGTPLRP